MSHADPNTYKRLLQPSWTPPENNNFVFKVGGKPFRCQCGCNVFHKLWDEELGEIIGCNGCDLLYEGE